MRTRLITILAALLASTYVAQAQTPPTVPAPPAVPSVGLFDFGFRGGTPEGDEARFGRYRDLRPGASTVFSMNQNTDRYRLGIDAGNVGYRDQRYSVDYMTGKLKISGVYDGIPLNYLYDAPLVWRDEGNGRFTLPLSVRRAVQGPTNAPADGTAVGVLCAPGSGPVGCNATNSATAISNRSIYNQLIRPDDVKVLRSVIDAKIEYMVTRAFGLNIDFQTTSREGSMPWNASFAFNNVNQLPAPIDHRNNELKAWSEWVNPKGMFRFNYWGSFFENNIQTLTWDNPIRATDYDSGLVLPFDANAYSNGNGPAFGQAALWPSNSLNSFGATGMYKALPKSTINGNIQLTLMRQNESLLPWTLNTSINNPAVHAAFPGIEALSRPSAQAAANGLNALVNFTSRPTRNLNIQMRYRYNDHNNHTPHFNGSEYVRFDGVPEEFEKTANFLTRPPYLEGYSEYFQVTRKNFDGNATFRVHNLGSLRVGYANELFDRDGRGFSETNEHTLRLAYDASLVNMVSIRTTFDSARRRGSGFILAGVDYEVGIAGVQPGLRYYDEANRDRTRAAVVFSVNPVPMAGFYVQYATTRDTFLPDDAIPAGRGHFGLLSQDLNAVVGGVDVSPNDTFHLGVSYGHDTFDALQRSRNASPPPDPTWTDPQRDWELDNNEVVKTIMAYVDVTGLAEAKADLRFSFERNDSDNTFTHGGPRIAALQVAGQFVPMPNVVNEWNRFTADLKYFVTPAVGVGVGYWYEKLDISDWNTLDSNGPVGFTEATGTPRIDWLGGLMTGYGNRPYEGHTAFVRLLYRF